MAKAKKSIKLRDPIVGLDQYGHRALQEAMATERDVEGASLEDRQEARDDFAKALKDPGLVAERIGWMKAAARVWAGDYGVEVYEEDPEASVHERIVIKADAQDRIA